MFARAESSAEVRGPTTPVILTWHTWALLQVSRRSRLQESFEQASFPICKLGRIEKGLSFSHEEADIEFILWLPGSKAEV